MPQEDQDIELDPKQVLKFGMSPKAIEELRQQEKKRRKKLAKNFRPLVH
jgi:hypothetical protein